MLLINKKCFKVFKIIIKSKCLVKLVSHSLQEKNV